MQLRALVLAILLAQPTLLEAGVEHRIPTGSVGVVFVADAKGAVQLRAVFPSSRVAPSAAEGTRVTFDEPLIVFDGKGVVARIDASAAVVKRGQVELTTTVPASAFSRQLKSIERVRGLAGFVLVAPADGKVKGSGVEWRATDDQRVLDGDVDGDGKPDAVVYVRGSGKKQVVSLLAGRHFDDIAE